MLIASQETSRIFPLNPMAALHIDSYTKAARLKDLRKVLVCQELAEGIYTNLFQQTYKD